MSEKKIVAKARVQIVLDIPLSDRWGEDCNFNQVQKQAVESAKQILRNGVVVENMSGGLHGKGPLIPVTIIGEPKVITILVEEDR